MDKTIKTRFTKSHKTYDYVFNILINFFNSHSPNKRHLRADDYLSLSSALRPRLLSLVGSIIITSIISSIVLPNLFSSISNVSAASLTLSVPSSISLNINPASSSSSGSSSGGSNGSVYAKSSNSNITIKTDANFGYTLSIKANNNNDLVNGNNKLTSITNAEGISEDNYKTSGANNTWGYIPSKLGGKDNTNIMPGPTSTNTTIEKTTQANTNNNNTYTIAIASKIDNTIASGTYKNSFVISAVSNSVSYSITYNLNQGSWNGKSPQTGTTTESSVKLDANIPTRDGFEFKGWCTQEPANNDTDSPSCSGQTYEAGQDYTLTNGANNVQLYAMWRSSTPTTMQDFGNYCSKMSQGQTLNLTDTRDGKTYAVSKLRDDGCWMTQNLSYEDTDTFYVTPLPDNEHYGNYYTYVSALQACPAGWYLPDQIEFETLANLYNSTTAKEAPMNIALGGYGYTDYRTKLPTLTSKGSQGYYWTSTDGYGPVGESPWYFGLETWGSGLMTNYNYDWVSADYGFAVRCKDENDSRRTMQTVQEWSSELSKIGDSTTAVDERDNNIYTIVRLADNKLWMTQNLTLGDRNLIDRTLTPENTNISSNYNLPENNQYNSFSSIYSEGPQSGFRGREAHVSYYSWSTATANSGTSLSSGEAQYSICPKGWRLPTGGSDGEFCKLAEAYGGQCSNTAQASLRDTLIDTAGPAFYYFGYFSPSYSSQQASSSQGRWWSSTASGSSNAYQLYFDNKNNVEPYHSDTRSYGLPIRCIAD